MSYVFKIASPSAAVLDSNNELTIFAKPKLVTAPP